MTNLEIQEAIDEYFEPIENPGVIPRFLQVSDDVLELEPCVEISFSNVGSDMNVGTASAIIVNSRNEGVELENGETISFKSSAIMSGLRIIANGTVVKIIYYG